MVYGNNFVIGTARSIFYCIYAIDKDWNYKVETMFITMLSKSR